MKSEQAALVATLTTLPSSGDVLSDLPSCVQWLEVRSDLVGDLDSDWLRSRFRGKLLYSLRSRESGGRSEISGPERRARMKRAARGYDLIELDSPGDLEPDILQTISAPKRMISWRGPAMDARALGAVFAGLAQAGAQIYRLVVEAERPGDEIEPLLFLKSLGRSDTIAYADGSKGFWTRLIAPRFGAALVFGAVAQNGNGGGEPAIRQLIEDYNLPALTPVSEMFGIVGDSVAHSLSPRLHNAAYRGLRRQAVFVPFHATSFAAFWSGLIESGKLERLGISLGGLTVASPLKEAAACRAGDSSPMVMRAESSNLFFRPNGKWIADTTDPEGVLLNLAERGVDVARKSVAVVGCGGSGRAVAAALDQAGSQVTLVNRGRERGELAVRLLGLPFVRLVDFRPSHFDLVVNATPIGRDGCSVPFEPGELRPNAVVVDLVYGPRETPLAKAARESGRTIIEGRDVLLAQVQCQFRKMTGTSMPDGLARRLLDTERGNS